jgi:hypothetical protein
MSHETLMSHERPEEPQGSYPGAHGWTDRRCHNSDEIDPLLTENKTIIKKFPLFPSHQINCWTGNLGRLQTRRRGEPASSRNEYAVGTSEKHVQWMGQGEKLLPND